jgi:hypothetical protein
MQQSSIRFASDEFIDWLSNELSQPIRLIEECGGSWEAFEFANAPDIGLVIIEREGGLVSTCRVQRFKQKSRGDTGAMFGFGARYSSGGVSATIEAQRQEFLSSMRRNLSYVAKQRAA